METDDGFFPEPAEVFHPLPAERAPFFYHLEMGGYLDDLPFYRHHLPPSGPILELGCGTGRLTCHLGGGQRKVIGIDIALPMLKAAPKTADRNCFYVCMDMRKLAFRTPFSAILIPYNTLNLLNGKTAIRECLAACRALLVPGGKLLAQLYVPNSVQRRQLKRTFQFQIFDNPQGGKVIKEVLKQYHPQSETLTIEERYRVRPLVAGGLNLNYRCIYDIVGMVQKSWLELFDRIDIGVAGMYCGDGLTAYHEDDSTMFVVLTKP